MTNQIGVEQVSADGAAACIPPVGAAPLFSLYDMQELARQKLDERCREFGSAIPVSQHLSVRSGDVSRWRGGRRSIPYRVFVYLGILASTHDTHPMSAKALTRKDVYKIFWAEQKNIDALTSLVEQGRTPQQIAKLMETPELAFTRSGIRVKINTLGLKLRTCKNMSKRVQEQPQVPKPIEREKTPRGVVIMPMEAGHPISWGCINAGLQTDLGAFQHFAPVITSLRECAECNADTDGRSYCWDCHARFYQPKVAPTKQCESAVYFALRSSPAYGA